MDEEKKKVVCAIRSLLISLPIAVSVEHLEHDYSGLMGHRIPYQKFGFKRIDDFLKSEDTLVLSRQNGKTVVTAKVIEKSAHIADLVSKQKTDKKKLLRKAHRHDFSRAVPTTNWRPKYIRHNRHNYQQPPRLAAVNHSQFISRGYEEPKVPSKIVIPESSALYSKQNSHSKKSDINSRLQVNAPVNKSHIVTKESVDNRVMEEPCSPLASTRKRIQKKMSEINLDRDSGNSSPTDETTQEQSFKIPEFVETGDSIVDLKNFVEHFKLGPLEISNKPVKTKRNQFVTSMIKIGKHTFQSYPKEFNTAQEAEKFCAKVALKELIPKYKDREALLIAGAADILEKIPPMLEKHIHGMWMSQLELDYADKYNEKLPFDWLKIVDSSQNIQLEKYLDSYIIRYCKPGNANKSNQGNTSMSLSDISVPANTVQPGEGGKINAQITCTMSTNEIWCRQCFTEEMNAYSDMIIKMDLFYNSTKDNLKADNITVGGFYIAHYENMWYRVKAIELQNSEVRCFFIDFGDEVNISTDNIYRLKREFALCQAQAFVCRLVGLEDLYEVSQNSDALQDILYKQVVLELSEIYEEDDITLPVFMYSSEDGKSINQELISLLTSESAPSLFEKDSITDVYVSNIESNGDIYIQHRSQGYKTLQKLLLELETQILENPRTDLIKPVTKDNSEGKIYLTKDKIDKHFYRVKIIDWAPSEDLAQIYFVDIGKAQVINVNKDILYPLENLSDILHQYKFQAFKVKMNIGEIPDNFVSITEKLMPLDQMVLVKITDNNDETPLAEFFKRHTDGTIFCINKSITMEIELKNTKRIYSTSRTLKRNNINFEDNQNKNVPSGGKLLAPELPSKGNYFKVYIPLAVNPYNFFIQPLSTNNVLNETMEKLQHCYKDLQYSPLQFDQIVPGNIYVSRHEDGLWYRTNVIKVIHAGSVSVFLCDFGYYTNLTVHQLFPLDPEFMELPYQAVKAKLSGIKPKFSKWTVNDCESFKALVEGRSFYSELKDVENDELYESDIVLSLTLIDTSGDEDISITTELVNKEIAVEIQ